jgi:hypothetical protein
MYLSKMESISELIEKYKANPYMNDKLALYLANLPQLMQTIENDHKQKMAHLHELNEKKETYIQQFMSQHLIFYIAQTELFIEYSDHNYSIISEDDITHYILSELQQNELKIWKYKIKKHILKRIKENLFSSSIPDSITIKSVFQHLSIFSTKNHIKYFLTILGDSMLGKKDQPYIYFIDSSFKYMIRKFAEQIYIMTNKSVSDTFKYKFYDHKYEHCRIITGICPELFPSPTKILNIISVSNYLSTKYSNAEGFLTQCDDIEFINTTLYLKLNNSEKIISMFIDETMHTTGSMSFKNFYFLWRSYLKQKNLPLIISHNNFKQSITQMNLCNDDIVPLTSKQLYIQDVKLFLDKYPYFEDQYDLSKLLTTYNELHENKLTEDMFRDIIILLNPN